MYFKIEEMWYFSVNDDYKCQWLGLGSLFVGSLKGIIGFVGKSGCCLNFGFIVLIG